MIAHLPGFLLVAAALPQGIPIADLDTNGLLDLGYPTRGAEGFAIGGGIPVGTGDTLPVYWDGAGTHFLPLLPGDDIGVASGDEGAGLIVGTSSDVINGHIIRIFDHAVVWAAGTVTQLDSIVTGGAALELKTAMAVDELGRIAGNGYDAALGRMRGYLLDQGFLTDLGELVANGGCDVWDMDEHGTIVGGAETSGGFTHAFSWSGGVMTDLHDPIQVPGRTSRIYAINDRGVCCGSADFIAGTVDFETAALFDHGTVTNLGDLGGGQAIARGLNEFGDVVGVAITTNYEAHAFLWDGGPMQDLNQLITPGSGWFLLTATAIDNEGRIVGEGIFNGALRAFIAVPDCNGSFAVYGYGCPGTGGVTPELTGAGCPTPDHDFAFVVDDGLANAFGWLLLGSGTGVLPVKPGCDLQILPLLPPYLVPITLDGFGEQFLHANLANGTPPFDLNIQALFVDAGAAHGLAATEPMAVHFQ